MLLNQYIENTVIGETVVEESVVLTRNDALSNTNENDGTNNFYQLFNYPDNVEVVIGEIVQVQSNQLVRSNQTIVGLQGLQGLELGFMLDEQFTPISQLESDYSFVPPNVNLNEVNVVLKVKQTEYQTTLDGDVIKDGTITTEKLSSSITNDIIIIEETLSDVQDWTRDYERIINSNTTNVNLLKNQLTAINNQMLKITDLETSVGSLTTEIMTDIPLLIERTKNELMTQINLYRNNEVLKLAELETSVGSLTNLVNGVVENLFRELGNKAEITPLKNTSIVDFGERWEFNTLTSVTVNGFLQKEGENFIVIRTNKGIITGLDFSPDVFDGKMTVKVEGL